MRFSEKLESFRVRIGVLWSNTGDKEGAFLIPGPFGNTLKVLASNGDQSIRWEHVSVSLPNRCPNWPEMCFIKDLFWAEDETVMQLHPAKSDYINDHNFCLHMWKPLDNAIPLPPLIAV